MVFYYHLVFLAISIALFGLGAGGIFSYVVAARPGNIFAKMGTIAAANGLAAVAALWFILTRAGDLSAGTLAAVYVFSALPFFFAGTVTSLAISEAVERVDRAYFFDLAGAAAGCLVLIRFLDSFGAPNTMIASGVFYSVAAAFWFNLAGSSKRRAAAVLMSLVLVALMVVNFKSHILDIHYAKGKRLPPERFAAWNSFSRVGVHFEGIWSIVIDADAATGIASFDWDRFTAAPALSAYARGSRHAVPGPARRENAGDRRRRRLRRRARARLRQPRHHRGRDQSDHRQHHHARQVRQGKSRTVFARRKSALFVEDGRSFVRGTSEKYGVIQATLVDTWASTAAGAFALSENNLYTLRRLLRLLESPESRRAARIHALGARSAARIAASGFARHRRARPRGPA